MKVRIGFLGTGQIVWSNVTVLQAQCEHRIGRNQISFDSVKVIAKFQT